MLHDSRGSLCEKSASAGFSQLFCGSEEVSLRVKAIEQIYGRKDEKDVIYISRDTDFVDGYGGKDPESLDYIYITPYSHRNPKLVLRNHSVVFVLLNTGVETISYRIPSAEAGRASVKFSFAETVSHRFFLTLLYQTFAPWLP